MLKNNCIKTVAAFAAVIAMLLGTSGCGINLTKDRTEYILLGGNSGSIDYDAPDATRLKNSCP